MMAPKEVVMAKVKRNGPCPCGSGNKAKRCCHGPVQPLAVRIMPPAVYRDSICELAGTTRDEFDDLFGELVDLPELDLSLQVPLPMIWTPEIDRAVTALHDDEEAFDQALSDVVSKVDSTVARLLLARAVIILRDAKKISKRLAALAVIELDTEGSAFFKSSVAESLAVLAGDQRTPSGLLVAAR